MWRPTGFRAGQDLWKLHLDAIFLPGLSDYSLSAPEFILKLLGHWAIALLQHGEHQSSGEDWTNPRARSPCERHVHHAALYTALHSSKKRLMFMVFKLISRNLYKCFLRIWNEMTTLHKDFKAASLLKAFWEQHPLAPHYGSINTPTSYSHLNMRKQ